jgi:lipid-A-disaccharide synthase
VDGVFGIGGDRLANAGVELLAHIRDLTALGVGDSIGRLGAWSRAWCSVRDEAARRRPRVALLVDTPEVNLPLARALTADGISVVWYIGPQVWAWRPWRLQLLRDRSEVVALVLPFEKELYDQAGVRAEFVGHPLLDEPIGAGREQVRCALGVSPETPLVALLPGSRRAEVAALAEPMIDAGSRLRSLGIRPVLAPGPDAQVAGLSDRAEAAGVAVLPTGHGARDLLGAADAALVASGTATLEAAIAGTPLAVVYRVGAVSWLLARLLVDVPYIGLPNWVAGRRVVPELVQDEAHGSAMAEMAAALLEPVERERQLVDLGDVCARLGQPGAARRVASLIRERLE